MNSYIHIYKQLEKSVINLTDSIYFDEKQKSVYSILIGDVILRCSVDIEAISKALYCRVMGYDKAVDPNTGKDLPFDTECIKLLVNKWHIDKKKIIIAHSNMHFDNCEITPLFNAEKRKENGSVWKQAYNAFKHNREEEIEQANIWNMLNALGALYILNLYYADESFWVETPIEKRSKYTNFSEIFEPALCDTTKIGITAQKNPEAITKLINPTFDESIFILKYMDDAFKAMQKAIGDLINASSSIKLEQGNKTADAFLQKIYTQVLPQYATSLNDAKNGLKNKEVILNKNALPIFGI